MLSHLYATRKCSKTETPFQNTHGHGRHKGTEAHHSTTSGYTLQHQRADCPVCQWGMTRRGMASPNVGYFQTVGYWRLETGRPLCSSRGSVISPARTSAQGDGTFVICSGHEKRPGNHVPTLPTHDPCAVLHTSLQAVPEKTCCDPPPSGLT